MPETSYIPAEIPLELDAANYDASRAAYYRATGAPRDDTDLPCRGADATRIVRRITGIDSSYRPVAGKQSLLIGDFVYRFEAPAEDFYLPDDYRQAEEPTTSVVVQPSQAEWAAFARGGARPQPKTIAAPDLSRAVFGLAPPALERLWRFDSRKPAPAVPPSFYPSPVRQELAGGWALTDASAHGKAFCAPGRQPVARAYPPAVDGQRFRFSIPWAQTLYLGKAPAKLLALPAGSRVLIRDPHPWLSALPAPAPGTGYVMLPAGFGENPQPLVRFRVVESNYIIVYDAPRLKLAQTSDGYYILQNEFAPSGNFLAKLENAGGLVGSAYRSVARNAAGKLVFLAALTVVTAGAGAGFAASFMAGAGSVSGAGVATSGVVGAPSSASLLPGGNSPASAVGMAPGSAANAPLQVFQAAIDNAQTIQQVYGEVDKENTDKALADIAVQSAWLGGFDSFYGDFFRLLATAAQSPADRAKVRLAIALEKLKVNTLGGVPLLVARNLYQAAAAALTAGAASELEAGVKIMLDVVTKLIEKAQALANAYENAQLLSALDIQMRQAHDRALGELLRRIDAGSPPEESWGAWVADSDPIAKKAGAAIAEDSGRPFLQRFLAELWKALTQG